MNPNILGLWSGFLNQVPTGFRVGSTVWGLGVEGLSWGLAQGSGLEGLRISFRVWEAVNPT